jgi:hypothetical protein
MLMKRLGNWSTSKLSFSFAGGLIARLTTAAAVVFFVVVNGGIRTLLTG